MRTFYLAFLYAPFYASGTFNIMNTLTVYGGGGGLVAKLCQTLVTPWTVACQAPPSMGFSRQEYWSGLPFPSPGDLPNPGVEPRSPALQADALTSEPPGNPFIYFEWRYKKQNCKCRKLKTYFYV